MSRQIKLLVGAAGIAALLGGVAWAQGFGGPRMGHHGGAGFMQGAFGGGGMGGGRGGMMRRGGAFGDLCAPSRPRDAAAAPGAAPGDRPQREPLSWERIETRRNECFAALDKSSDGFVDKAEAEAALTERMMWRGTTMLRRIDANLDGRVTKDEFNRHAKERFTAADINDDGRITEADMPPGFAQRQAGDSAAGTGGDQDQGRRGRWRKALAEGITWDKIEARRADAFKRFDRNGDGVIDRADVEAGVKERAAYWAIRWVRSFDRNRDGKVDKAEYNRRAREDFAVRDVNGDGRITDDDLPPFMRGRGGPR